MKRRRRQAFSAAVSATGTDAGKNPFSLLCERLAIAAFLLLTFLLPLKFGQLAMMSEMPGFFPPGWSDFVFITWPANSFGLFSGAALCFMLVLFRNPDRMPWSMRGLLLLLPLSLPGVVNASSVDPAVMLFGHLTGIVAYAAAAWLLLSAVPRSRVWLLNAFALGAVCVVLAGLHQYFWGFTEQLEYFRLYGAPDSMRINQDFLNKLAEKRVFATIANCNTLAGFLLLSGFLMISRLKNWLELVESPQWFRAGGCLVAAGALLAVICLTGSRAALASLVGTAAIMAVLLLPSTKGKWITAGIFLFCATAGFFVLFCFSDRGFASLGERLLYWRSSLRMLAEHPFCGSGWGDFFYDHMLYKGLSANDEAARWPHNILLAFGSQSGVFPMLCLAGTVLYALGRAAKKAWKHELSMDGTAILAGGIAFFAHALCDVDFQIPCSMAIFCVFLILAEGKVQTANVRLRRCAVAAALVFLALASGGLAIYATICESRLDCLQQQCRSRRPDPAAIESVFQSLEKLRPFSPYQMLETGDWRLEQGHPELAVQLYREALKRAPKRPATYYRLYRCSAMLGDREAAKRYLAEAVRRFPAGRKYRVEWNNFK